MLGCALAVAILGVQGWRDWRGAQPRLAATAVSGASSGQVVTISVDELIAIDLMGAARALEPQTLSLQNIPETRLDLGLHGVFASEQANLAGAVIVADGKKSGFYRIGDAIAPGVVLHAVATDSIVIKRGGILETLNFLWHKPGSGAADEPAPAKGARATGATTESGSTIRQSLRAIGSAASQEQSDVDVEE
ncbi:MAG: type II secretion system protein N [Porticoccaceae bacterium]